MKRRLKRIRRNATLIRAGAWGQMTARNKLSVFSSLRGRSTFIVKTSAGASMSEYAYDIGCLQSTFHAEIDHPRLMCNRYDDPPDVGYVIVKS
jgi:hypothetical protein